MGVLKRKWANTGSGKHFQGQVMRAIDSSHRKTPYRVDFMKIKKLEKIAKLPFFGDTL
jgi:hypothetical protein